MTDRKKITKDQIPAFMYLIDQLDKLYASDKTGIESKAFTIFENIKNVKIVPKTIQRWLEMLTGGDIIQPLKASLQPFVQAFDPKQPDNKSFDSFERDEQEEITWFKKSFPHPWINNWKTEIEPDVLVKELSESVEYCQNESAIDFTEFVNERTKNFVGREQVYQSLDGFRKNYESGYFVLCGKPGMGKSAFLSSLAKQNNEIHHFIDSQRNGRNSIHDVLDDILSKIARKYNHNISRDIPIERILKLVSDNLHDEEKCIIIIDAIDELKEFNSIKEERSTNILNFPRTLPKGIYCVFSIRERDQLPLRAMNIEHFELHPDAEGNESDIRTYIRTFLEREGVEEFMLKNKLRKEDFEDLLSQKSEGNFMYLHCVLPQIEAGYYKDVELKEIPKGLYPYYENHWDRIKGKDKDAWFEYKLPIISMLTLSGMRLSVEMIREYARLPKTSMVVGVLDDWKQFFFKEDLGIPSLNLILYRLYHSSFKDFLKQKSQVQAEKIDMRRFLEDFIMKNKKNYGDDSNLDDFLDGLKGDI